MSCVVRLQPPRYICRLVFRREVALAILDLIHPGHFSALPPSPDAIVRKGLFTGLLNNRDEAFRRVFY